MITDKIHEDLNRASVARKYYMAKGIGLTNDQAKKKFYQDNATDKIHEPTLLKVLKQLVTEQINLLK